MNTSIAARVVNSKKTVPLFMALVIGMSAFGESTNPEAKQPLRILYIGGDAGGCIGRSRSKRAADFQQFLEKHFISVAMTKGSDFKPELAKDVDVIVKDARIPIVLPPTFRKPMVLVGSNGLYGIDRTGTKIDLLCECLRDKLHTIRLDHRIFQGPFPVKPTIVQEADPVTGNVVGMWKVQEKMDSPGLVTANEQFVDAGDSEIISGGVNMKGDHGVALVREANLFLWGPIANPSLMTEEARRVFVNTIVYMKQFDGAKQTVWRGLHGRKELEMVLATKDLSERSVPGRVYDDFLPTLVDSIGQHRGISRILWPEPGLRASAPWRNLVRNRPGCQSLGFPITTRGCWRNVSRSGSDPAEAPKALRLLQRYTGLSLTDATAWQDWLKKNLKQTLFLGFL